MIVLSGLAVQMVLVALHTHSNGMAGLTIWAMSGRLRDLGRSGWWTLAIFALVIGSIVATLSMGRNVAIATGGLVEIACAVVLGVLPGQPGQNRFGPAPGQPSIAETAEVFS